MELGVGDSGLAKTCISVTFGGQQTIGLGILCSGSNLDRQGLGQFSGTRVFRTFFFTETPRGDGPRDCLRLPKAPQNRNSILPLAAEPFSQVLDGVFQRTQGLSALFLKPPLPQDLKEGQGDYLPGDMVVVGKHFTVFCLLWFSG